MLRQVSFTFWRVCQDRAFDASHGLIERRSDKQIVRRAKELLLCPPCAKQRLDRNYYLRLRDLSVNPYPYCPYYRENRSKVHFRHMQRMRPRSARRCILSGSDAPLGLCSHLSIFLPSVWKMTTAADDRFRRNIGTLVTYMIEG